MKIFVLFVVVLMPVLAGCTGDGTPVRTRDTIEDESQGQAPHDDPPTPSETDTTRSPYDPGWPELAHATIRPGVAIGERSSCTSNFIFKSPDNQTLYIGTAAHCVTLSSGSSGVSSGTEGECSIEDTLPIGSPIIIEGASKPGRLAYTSWQTMKDAGEADPAVCIRNDLALIEISETDRARTHPALLHYGGPTGLADGTTIQAGEHVLSYGRSEYHGGVEAMERREGYVLSTSSNGWSTRFYAASPGMQGDSGSAVITGSGQAVGVLYLLLFAPHPAANEVVNLDKALSYAQEHAGIEVQLATWNLIQEGVLPQP